MNEIRPKKADADLDFDALAEIGKLRRFLANRRFVVEAAFREFLKDGCADIAAGLTYRTIFSIFPALIAMVSILSLLGQSGDALTNLMLEAERILPADTWGMINVAVMSLMDTPSPGLGLFIGLAVALWSASGYIKAFSRAMNLIYEVPEGRGVIKFNLQMYLLTALVLVLGSVALTLSVISGPVATVIGNMLGFGETAWRIWGFAKWSGLIFIVLFVVALLYWATPNVRQPKFRWLSPGAFLAILIAAAVTYGFFTYVAHFGNYNATYGTLAGLIIAILWLYLLNSSLLFGAEIDAESIRRRLLVAGEKVEGDFKLPLRDEKAANKSAAARRAQIDRGRALRLSGGATANPDWLPDRLREHAEDEKDI